MRLPPSAKVALRGVGDLPSQLGAVSAQALDGDGTHDEALVLDHEHSGRRLSLDLALLGEHPDTRAADHRARARDAPDDVQDLVSGVPRVAAEKHEGDLSVAETASFHRRGRRVEHGCRQTRRCRNA